MKTIVCIAMLFLGCSSNRALSGLSGGLVMTTTTAAPTSTTLLPTSTMAPPTTTTGPSIRTTTSTTTTSTTSSTTTSRPPRRTSPTLLELVEKHFDPADHDWALRVAACESSADAKETFSTAVNTSSGSSGWFQHLPRFWDERSAAAGVPGASILDPEANVTVAAWLLYETPQAEGHWYPSESCWRR